jgi:hypothetical protein
VKQPPDPELLPAFTSTYHHAYVCVTHLWHELEQRESDNAAVMGVVNGDGRWEVRVNEVNRLGSH